MTAQPIARTTRTAERRPLASTLGTHSVPSETTPLYGDCRVSCDSPRYVEEVRIRFAGDDCLPPVVTPNQPTSKTVDVSRIGSISTCGNCGRLFRVHQYNQKYCNGECKHQAGMMQKRERRRQAAALRKAARASRKAGPCA